MQLPRAIMHSVRTIMQVLQSQLLNLFTRGMRPRDVVTDEAAPRAVLGLRIERQGVPGSTVSRPPSPAPAPAPPEERAPSTAASAEPDLRRAVRAAVVAELGRETAGLNAAIDKVLRERSR